MAGDKKKLIYKCAVLLMLLFNAGLILFVSLGWFTTNRTVDGNGINIQAIGGSDIVFTASAEYMHHSEQNLGWRTFSGRFPELYPGEYVTIRILISNSDAMGSADSKYAISFNDAAITYPEGYSDDAIAAGPYTVSGTGSFTPDSTDFESFIEPMTNAFRYSSFIGDISDFSTLAAEEAFADENNPTDYLTSGLKKSNLLPGVIPVVNDDNCRLAAGESKYVFITIYFDQDKNSSADITLGENDTIHVEMSNSNAYLGQTLTMDYIGIAASAATNAVTTAS